MSQSDDKSRPVVMTVSSVGKGQVKRNMNLTNRRPVR